LQLGKKRKIFVMRRESVRLSKNARVSREMRETWQIDRDLPLPSAYRSSLFRMKYKQYILKALIITDKYECRKTVKNAGLNCGYGRLRFSKKIRGYGFGTVPVTAFVSIAVRN
jgi:hypothetical protein